MKTFLLVLLSSAGLLSHAGAALSATGLVGYYSFDGDGNDTAEALGGNTSANHGGLVDNATNGTVGTLQSGYDATTKAFGSGSLAVTNGDYFTLNYPAEVQFGSGSFTFAYWLRLPTNITSDPSVLSNKNWSGSGTNLGFSQSVAGDDMRTNVKDATLARADTGTVDLDPASGAQGPANNPPGAWVFVAMVVDRDAALLSNYVADTWVPATTGTWGSGVSGADFGPDSSNPTTISIAGRGSFDTNSLAGYAINVGQDGDGEGYTQLTANIDDLSVWNRALSREELWQIYHAGRQGQSIAAVVPEASSVFLGALGLLAFFRRRR